MDSRPPKCSKIQLIVAILGMLVLGTAPVFLPLYDCPMCGNPPNSGFRACYCNSSGKVNLIGRIRFPGQRTLILDAMGYCGNCEKLPAIGRLNVTNKDGTAKQINVCEGCASLLLPNRDRSGDK